MNILKKCNLSDCLNIENDKKHCTHFIPNIITKPNDKKCEYYCNNPKQDKIDYYNIKAQMKIKRGRGPSKKIKEDDNDEL